MKLGLLRTLTIVALIVLVGCATASPTTAPPAATSVPATATFPPPTETPAPTNTPIPPTETPTPTATPIPPTPLPPLTGSGGGVIAFTSGRDGNYGIYVMNADGTDQRQLTDEYVWSPAWSPDGK